MRTMNWTDTGIAVLQEQVCEHWYFYLKCFKNFNGLEIYDE